MQELELVDVHCHIYDKIFDENRDKVIENALKVGVKKIVCSPLDAESLEKTISLMEKYPKLLYCTAGFDYSILDLDKFEEYVKLIKTKIDKIVGIGEVGIDYFMFRKEEDKKRQESIFRNWIRIAKELNLPLVVHSRSAGKYAIKILIDEKAENVIMHAFDGSVGYAIEGAKKGFYFSIPPSIVRSEQKQKLVKHISISNLLLESDSPVLGPNKDIINTPSNVIISAGRIAEIKKIPLYEVIEKTSNNAYSLFKFK